MTEPFKIGVAGLGTVGVATLRLLATHANLLAERCGRPIRVAAVSARDRARARGVDLAGIDWVADPAALARRGDLDMVVELIGGANGAAKSLIEAALAAGKHVVTANKALLAHDGTNLAKKAEEAGVELAYEAAVCGGIPIIDALRGGLAANRISRVYGILNGTCNFILTEMREKRLDFARVVADAQKKGYAEADPSMDVDGIDAAHKLAILTSVAFGCEMNLAGVYVEGIRHIAALDIGFAGELGYRIKLLGLARLTPHGVEQRVHPCLVPVAAPVALIDGVLNAVVAEGDFVGSALFEGYGAGGGPTASAAVSDIVRIARGVRLPTFSVPAAKLARLPVSPMERHIGAYYIRLMVVDRPGVVADVTAALRDENVSLASMLQHGRAPDDTVPVVLTTHETEEAAMRRAIARIGAIAAIVEKPCVIRIESL